MARFVNHKLFLKIIIICLCIIEITNGKKVEVSVKKSTRIYGKKQHISINDPTKKVHPEFSLENRKKFVEKELESFKLKSEININNKNVKDEKQNVKQKISTKVSNEHKKETNIKTKPKKNNVDDLKVNSSSTTEEKKNEADSYYIYCTGIVSIALVGVGFFNVYQRSKNSIFNLTKEELEYLDNKKKINNSYTSLSEEERQFLHKINTRKHNNTKRYDELTEEEILEIRKKNGWADSDDGECQLRRRKIDNRLSCNIKINNTNVVAPRRISLNTKLDKDLLSKSSYRKSSDDVKKLKSMISMNKDNLAKHSNSYEYLKLSKDINSKKSLSINTKNLIPPIKMVCTIIKNYKPVRPDEIEIHLGDKVEIINIYKDGWATGKVICEDNNNDKNNQKIGYFPLAHASEPEVFDDKINEFIIPSPITPPVSRSFSNISYQKSPLTCSSNSYQSHNINLARTTAVAVTSTKSRNRHVSMIALSSSSILTQEPIPIQNNSSNSSVINISNNINIIGHNLSGTDNNSQQNININININNNNNNNSQKYINNSISINNNENTSLINTNTVLSNFEDSSVKLKYRNSTSSIIDPQSITNLLNDVLDDSKTSGRIASTYSKKKELLPCHSQKVFDFLRGNVYNSKIPMEEREYYKKCLERLRISKIIDMEVNQTEKQKIQKKCE
ncbi:hypothetical protein U3516DRAFT_636252 [Neocallimastix sp. 'constans']|jgi:hypothetical protein